METYPLLRGRLKSDSANYQKTRETLRRRVELALPKVAEELLIGHTGVHEVWLFGSFASGNYRPGSDVDLAVVAPEWGFAELSRAERELGESHSLPFHLLLLKESSAELKEQGVCLACSPSNGSST